MDWKVLFSLLLCFMLVISVFAGCTQQTREETEAVRRMVLALPTVEEFKALDEAARLAAYNATQKAYDAYQALSQKQQARLTDELAKIEELFAYFNTQLMPLE